LYNKQKTATKRQHIKTRASNA